MPQRYVRVKTTQGNIHYGSLNLNRSVAVFDAAPWDGGQPSGVVLKADSYQFVAPCFPSKIVVLLTLNSSEGATKLWLFFTSAAAPLSY